MRKMTVQEISRDGLFGLGDTIRTMALAEGLDAHAAAVEVRLTGISSRLCDGASSSPGRRDSGRE